MSSRPWKHKVSLDRSSRGGPHKPVEMIRTDLGVAYWADTVDLLRDFVSDASVDLIVTSPPFGLVRKKDYGNADADEYVDWFRPFADQFKRVLRSTGSLGA